jgi:hypothetical protein
VTVGFAVAALSFGVGGGAAFAGGCPDRVTNQSFRNWGDEAQYFRAKNGGFEKKMGGWQTIGKPVIVAENEPWFVGDPSDRYSAQLSAGMGINIKTFCIWDDEDALRFFYKSPGKPGAKLDVAITVLHGKNEVIYKVSLDGSQPGWQVTDRLPTQVLKGSGSTKLGISISTSGTAATWLVDDVMIDPWRTQ